MSTLQMPLHPLRGRSPEMDDALTLACAHVFTDGVTRPGDITPDTADRLSERSVEVFLGVIAEHAEAMTPARLIECGRVFGSIFRGHRNFGAARMDAIASKRLRTQLSS